MMEKITFKKTVFEAISELPAEQYKECMTAIASYLFDGEMPELTGASKAVFMLVMPQLEADYARRQNGKKGGEYGHLGGRPKTPKKPQENPKETPRKPQGNPKETPRKPLESEAEEEVFDPFPVQPSTEVVERISNLNTGYTEQFTANTVNTSPTTTVTELNSYSPSKGNKNINNNPKKKATNVAKEKRYFDHPELNESFTAYLKMREKMKKPVVGERAINNLKKKLMGEKLANGDIEMAIRICDQSVEHSWIGLFELKDEPRARSGTINDPWAEAAEEVERRHGA